MAGDRRETLLTVRWIREKAAHYPGSGLYQDVPHAVSDENVVTASGTAPISFAAECLARVFPHMQPLTEDVKILFAKEHS